MGRRLLQLGFALLSLACLLGVVLSRTAAPEHLIKVAFLGSNEDEDYFGALAFKEHVEAASGGRIRVEIYPSGAFCGSTEECIEGLRSGVLEVHMATVGGVGSLYGPLQVLDLPYVLPNDRVAECVLDSALLQDFRAAMLEARLGLRLMTIGNTGGWRSFATRRPVAGPEDLAGMKIRTTSAAIEQAMVRELGANPTPVAWSELYTALATGVVDGAKNSVVDLVSLSLEEHLKYVIRDRHSYLAALWFYSEDAWARLPPELRPIVEEGFERLKEVTRALPKERNAAAEASFLAAGGVITEPDARTRAAFLAAARPVRDWYVARYGEAWLQRTQAAVAACGPP